MNDAPLGIHGQINYLQNSNNIHNIFRSTPDPGDPLRNNPDALPRRDRSNDSKNNSNSRSRSPSNPKAQATQNMADNYHYEPGNMAATSIAHNMQSVQT